MAITLALLILPLILLWRLSLTPQQNAKRLRSKGWKFKQIANYIHVHPSTASRYCRA